MRKSIEVPKVSSSRSGFGITQALVAIAITTIAGAGVASMLVNMNKSLARGDRKQEATQFVEQLRNEFQNTQMCVNNLQSALSFPYASNPSEFTNPIAQIRMLPLATGQVIAAGQKLGPSSQVYVDRIYVDSLKVIEARTHYTATLNIDLYYMDGANKHSFKSKGISLSIKTDPDPGLTNAAVLDCQTSMLSSLSSSELETILRSVCTANSGLWDPVTKKCDLGGCPDGEVKIGETCTNFKKALADLVASCPAGTHFNGIDSAGSSICKSSASDIKRTTCHQVKYDMCRVAEVASTSNLVLPGESCASFGLYDNKDEAAATLASLVRSQGSCAAGSSGAGR